MRHFIVTPDQVCQFQDNWLALTIQKAKQLLDFRRIHLPNIGLVLMISAEVIKTNSFSVQIEAPGDGDDMTVCGIVFTD